MGYRKEIDLLGELEIENSAYYGIHTKRAIQNFVISTQKNGDTPEFIRGVVQIKKAAALANVELKVIEEPVAKAIVYACDAILETDDYLDQFPVDAFQGGAGTSLNMNVNEVIANIALEYMGYKKGEYSYVHPNDDVNESQSTNDAYPSGLRMALYRMSESLIETALYLKFGLLEKATEFIDVLKMGRTQLQDAVPMSLGQEFNAFATLIDKSIDEIKKARKTLLVVNLGATAIGTGVNTPPGYTQLVVKKLSEVTGYECKTATDLISATSDTSDFVTFHASLKTLAIRLSKIANDLRLLSSGPRAGLHEINLPELQAGSSIMPAKINPVLPEAVNNACFKVYGNDTVVSAASDAGQLQLNAMEPVMAQAMFESLTLLKNCCRSLQDKCVSGITANTAYCSNYLFNSIGLVTYLNPIIGHNEGDIVGRICVKTGKSVKAVILERELMTEEEFDELFTLEKLRKTIGLS